MQTGKLIEIIDERILRIETPKGIIRLGVDEVVPVGDEDMILAVGDEVDYEYNIVTDEVIIDYHGNEK